MITQLVATIDDFAVKEAWRDLDYEDKANYLIIVSTLRTVTNLYNKPSRAPYLKRMQNQYDTMLKLGVYLRAFDDELAEVYERDAGEYPTSLSKGLAVKGI